MTRLIAIFCLIMFLIGCKNDAAQTPSPNSKIAETKTKTEEIVDTDDLGALLQGTYEGMGTYSANTGNEDVDFNVIKLTKKDKNTVVVSSPVDIFPDFEINNLEDQMTTIIGKTGADRGFMSYNKATKKIKGLVKNFINDSKTLRFGMP